MIGYVLPSSQRTLAILIDHPTAALSLLVEDPSFDLVAGALERGPPQPIEGRTFQLLSGRELRPGDDVRVRFDRRVANTQLALIVTVTAVVVAMLFGAWLLRRRLVVAPAGADALAAQIAVLDRDVAAQADVPPEARKRYESERARLKDALKRALANEVGARPES